MRTLSIASSPHGFEVVYAKNNGAATTTPVILWALTIFDAVDAQAHGGKAGQHILPVIMESDFPKILSDVGSPTSRYLAVQKEGRGVVGWEEKAAEWA
jgi:hypothetical protein